EFGWVGQPYDYFQTEVFNDIYLQPIKSSCWLDRAVLHYPQVGLQYHDRLLGSVYWALLADAISAPGWHWDIEAANQPQYFLPDPNPYRRTWDPANPGIDDTYDDNFPNIRNAEYRGACGGGNIGSALGHA